MIGNSPVDYVGIRIGIGALRAVAPASIGYLACCAIWHKWFVLPVALVATAEAAFYLFIYLPRKSRLQSPPRSRPTQLTFEQRQLVFRRCMAAEQKGISPELLYPRGWFLPQDTPPLRDDVIDWLLWALFSSSRDEINLDDHKEELDGYIREIEMYHNQPLVEGRSHEKGLYSMRITVDPVGMSHRPLVWYMIVALVDSFTSISLIFLGFKHYTPVESQWRRTFPPRPILYLLSRSTPPGVITPYWYRPHTSKSKVPIMFLHGIGIGLLPYLPFFRSIVSGDDSDVGIVLPEMMSICMHMTPRSVPPREEMLASLNVILESLRADKTKQNNTSSISDDRSPLLDDRNDSDVDNSDWDRIVLVAHSYGTFVAGWILRSCIESSLDPVTTTVTSQSAAAKSLASKLAHLVLVDPIPILLSNPAVAYNFLYRHPSTVPPPPSVVDPETLLVSPPSADGAVSASLQTSSWYSSAAAWQLWYFASRDADVARTLFRSFFWAEGGLWREDLVEFVAGKRASSDDVSKARNLAVVLGGMDQIIPSEAIRVYLTGEFEWKDHWTGTADAEGKDLLPLSHEQELHAVGGRSSLEVLFNPRLDHAVIFDDPKWTKALLDVVYRYIKD